MPRLWDCEVYGRSMSRPTFDVDVAALGVDDRPADGQPEPEPASLLADRPRPEETLEEPVLLVRGDARPLVRDRDADEAVRGLGADRDLGALRRVLARVRDEVGE